MVVSETLPNQSNTELTARVAKAIYDDETGEGAWADLLASAKVHKLTRPTATERKYHQRARAVIEALGKWMIAVGFPNPATPPIRYRPRRDP